MKSNSALTAALLICRGALIAAALGATACSRDPQTRKAQHLSRADAYAEQGKVAEAVVEYRNAVQAAPQDGEVRLKLADAYLRRGEGGAAINEYVRAADLLVNRVDVQLKAGNLLLLAGRFDDARVRADKALAVDGKSVDATILLANALAGLKQFDAAIVEIEEAIRIAPERGSVYTNLGALEVGRGRMDAAELAFKKATELDPRSASAHLALANFYWMRERWPEAELELKTALDIEPKNVVAHRAMASYAFTHNRPDDAEQHLKQVHEVTKSRNAALALADFYVARNDAASARKMLEPLTTASGADPDATIRLATLDHAAGRRDEAYSGLEQVLAKSQNQLQALLAKSRMLLADDRAEEALKAAELAVKSHPQSAVAFATLGRVQVARRKTDAAIAAYTEVLKLNPRASGARLVLSRLHLAEGRPDASVGFAEEAVKDRPRSPDARLTLVRGLLQRGDLARAEQELTPLLKSFPKSAVVQVQYGILLGRKKDLAGSRRAFEQALKLDPKSVEALGGLVATDMAAKQPDAARARMSSYMERPDVTPAGLMLAARTYAATGDMATAERLLRRVIESDAAYMPAYAAIAQIYVKQGRLDAAIRELDAMAAREAKPVGALTLAGIILLGQGKNAEARARFERALQIDPTAPVAANNLAWMMADSGSNLDEALQLAQTATRRLPDSAEVSDTLGFIYLKKGLLPQAIQTLAATVQKDPSKAEYHYHLGLALSKGGDSRDAAEHLERALALNANFPGAADARTTLQTLRLR